MSDSSDTQTDTSDQNFAALRAQHEAAQRENVFLRAGIDVDTAQGKLLMKGYEGPVEVDAIKAYRDEVFPAAPAPAQPAPTSGDEPPAQAPANTDPYANETAGQQAVRDALAGASGPGQQQQAPDVDTLDDAFENYHKERRSGVPLERAQLGVIDRVIVAAAEGKTDVLFDQAEWDRQKAEAGHKPRQMQEQ